MADEALSSGGVYVAYCTVGNSSAAQAAAEAEVWPGMPPLRQKYGPAWATSHDLFEASNQCAAPAFVAVNPLSWRCNDGVQIGAEQHLGTFDGETSVQHLLAVTVPTEGCCAVVDDRVGSMFTPLMQSFASDSTTEPIDYHRGDYSLFWVNLRSNVKARVDHYLQEHLPIKAKLELPQHVHASDKENGEGVLCGLI